MERKISDRSSPIFTIKREKHLQHLVNVAPFVAVAFVVQCYLLTYFFQDAPISHFALPLAISLSLMISGLVIYDSYHFLECHSDHFQLGFKFFNLKQQYFYHEISHVEVLEPEASFSSLVIHFITKNKKVIYFVDDAESVKKIIEGYQQKNHPYQQAA
jgi:hypothetical protein